MSTPKTHETLPQRIIIRHTSGSKAGQSETFNLAEQRQVLFGRDTRSDVVFDPDREDLVSRQHARIEQDAENPLHFTITDLESRNGTFVNKQRVMGVARINPSDEIHFGPGGPSFAFDLDPRPSSLMRRTRLASLDTGAAAGSAAPTREMSAGMPPAADRSDMGSAGASRGSNVPGSNVPVKTSVGKATVERMLSSSQRSTQRSTVLMAAGLGVVMLIVAGVFLLRDRDTAQRFSTADQNLGAQQDSLRQAQLVIDSRIQDDIASRPMSIAQIASENTESVIMIEMAWKLIDSRSGRQIYHEHVPCEQLNKTTCPAYRQRPDGGLEPMLTLESDEGKNEPIAQSGSRGSGFVVSSNGFIMTNRHVAAPWYHSYTTFPSTPSLVYGQNSQGDWNVIGQTQQPPTDWIPALALESDPVFSGKNVEGELVYLDVTFAGDEQRFPAQLTGHNATHDVAMIKINVPRALRAVTLNDNYENIEVGEEVVVMGYPGLSPDVVTVTASQNWEKNISAFTVPDPTTTPASIGRVIRGQQISDGNRAYYSQAGDFYQLSTNETGAGNSGGPVFDRQGRVLGIFAAARASGGERLTYAVPVRFGMKLMGPGQVLN